MLVQQQKEAAKLLGVTATALRQWEKDASFPDFSAGYDIEKIRDWVRLRDRKGSARSNRVELYREKLLKEKVRRERLLADSAERRGLVEQDLYRPVAEYDAFIAEVLTLARDRFMSLPKILAIRLPKKHHKDVIQEGEREAEKILIDLAESLRSGPVADAG